MEARPCEPAASSMAGADTSLLAPGEEGIGGVGSSMASPEEGPSVPEPSEGLVMETKGVPGQPHTLYLGNLNPRYSPEVLCSILKDILGTAGLVLQRHHIEVVKKPRQAYALVQLGNEMSLEHIAKQLLVAADMEQSLIRELVVKGKTLVVAEGKQKAPSSQEDREVPFPESAQSDLEVTVSSSPAHRSPGSRKPGKGRARGFEATQLSPKPWGSPAAQSMMSRRGTRSDSAIVQQEIVGQERLFYGAFMGSETRNVEFKRGSGEYLMGTLKHHVRKYVCAFLNSEGGGLFVGVEDTGFVHGVHCGHREEDRIRLLIDSILKGFKPQVFPDTYALTFIPVVKAGDPGTCLKVIRLSIQAPGSQGELLLYETDQGEVYLRRDGSIQGPLSGSAIQEWCRQKWSGELKKLEEKIEVLLKEKENLLQQLNQLQSPQPRSKVCTIV
ncbi:schlafen-like protein 1 [Apteryx rowi]|uniref:schlafen-like protein 1 n=1 Tax=Apteryx rowi TaxID=308060 RepID=UPI000E1C4CDA|nr:schlafen-like protein 1 [Apteryx rowi]XP_025932120.1 schlafen-like protein 1 [Apteryx rowi]XP_025932121.1 schlafen-like protein 1 [Apteryx rowi]